MAMTDGIDWSAVAARVRNETFVRHVERHESLRSTNDRAAELAGVPELPLPAAVLTAEQTAGRGRGGNVWRSGPGALTFSLVVVPSLPRERWPLLSLAAGLAVRDAVATVAVGHDVRVKWPNDVHLDGRKVGGILIEVPSPRRAVVGVGINADNTLADAPQEIRTRAVSIREAMGRRCDVGDLLVGTLVRLEAEFAELATWRAVPAARWARHCLLTGRAVRLRTPAGDAAGLCRGVTADGGLILDGPAGGVFYAGEAVMFSEGGEETAGGRPAGLGGDS